MKFTPAGKGNIEAGEFNGELARGEDASLPGRVNQSGSNNGLLMAEGPAHTAAACAG
ncbi:hypothetical protein [Erwinia sp. E602]|uniref:hypothetical protein n=1 Tax=Erwinia sp. E602 TaxID=2675378 RepID=UPI001BAD2FD4|nr:hypothetical protein [Erwinia sp. E602]